MNLITLIQEQSDISFTGRLNVLNRIDNKFEGVLYFKEGCVVFAQYQGAVGVMVLFELLILDLDHEKSYVLEPEIIEDSQVLFNESISSIKQKIKPLLSHYIKFKKHGVPEGRRFVINEKYWSDGNNLTEDELSILTLLTESNKVSDIIEKTNLSDMRVYMALVSLREKSALSVLRGD